MSEIKPTKKLYNVEFKEKFIDEYDNESTRTAIENILANAALSEEVLGKDLYDFNLGEIAQVIKASNPLNVQAAYGIGRHIYRYIQFAANIRRSNLHPMDGIDPDWYKNLVGKNKKYLFSKNEITDIISQLENKQDQAMIILLFEGARGLNNSELINLRKQDIDEFRNELILHDDKDKSARVIKVSPWCIFILKQAIESLNYHRSTRSGKTILAPVCDNDYIFRSLKLGNHVNEKAPINFQVLNQRLMRMREQLGLPYLRIKGLQQSGMINMGFQLFKRDKVLESKQLEEIANQYNTGNYIVGSGNKPYLNVTLFKNIVSRDHILDLYDVDINAVNG
jgi:integrase